MARAVGASPATIFEADFSKGQISDADPEVLAMGQTVKCQNMMLDKPGVVYKRGGIRFVGDPFGTGNARVDVASFPAINTPELLSWNLDLGLYRLVAGVWTLVSSYGADPGYTPAMKPVIVPDPDNTTTRGTLVWGVAGGNDVPRKYSGAGAAVAAFSPATQLTGETGGRYLVPYKGRLALASSTKFEQRVWFSPDFATGVETDWKFSKDEDGNPEFSYIDADHKLTGLIPLSNVLLLLSRDHVERITGSSPPPGSDMSHGVLGQGGCIDSRSVAAWRDNGIWAGEDGVFMSNGATINDLTEEGGIKRDWIAHTDGWIEDFHSVAGCVYRNFYFVSLFSPDPITYVLDIPRRVWWTLDFGLGAQPSWWATHPTDVGKFYAVFSTPDVYQVASMFDPTNTNTLDAGEHQIVGQLTTRLLNARSLGMKHFVGARLDYELDGDSTVAITTTCAGEDLGTETLGESDGRDRVGFDVAGIGTNIQFDIVQDNPTIYFGLHELEVDYRPLPMQLGGKS